MADNHTSPEIIFPIAFDGQRTKTWGGMTFLVHAAIGGDMKASEFGVNGGWGGLRTTKNIVNLFPNSAGTTDKRANFYSQGQLLEVDNITQFTHGYPITKYKNITSTGQAGSDPVGDHPDNDFPMFRLADAYLNYAEAVLRDCAGGDAATALNYIKLLRQWAYGNNLGNIASNQLTLNFILDERVRELNWEGHRRQDLIRFGLVTSDTYLWPWKGGMKEGKGVENFRVLFPLPASDISANRNLTQNTGY